VLLRLWLRSDLQPLSPRSNPQCVHWSTARGCVYFVYILCILCVYFVYTLCILCVYFVYPLCILCVYFVVNWYCYSLTTNAHQLASCHAVLHVVTVSETDVYAAPCLGVMEEGVSFKRYTSCVTAQCADPQHQAV
jgi:hypothetical protein